MKVRIELFVETGGDDFDDIKQDLEECFEMSSTYEVTVTKIEEIKE